MKTVLVTGAAGFIGYHVSLALLKRGDRVIGVDVMNDYYDVTLKEARLKTLGEYPDFRFERLDIADKGALDAVFASERVHRVVNLAAQAGVRHSLTHPEDYAQSNLVGFLNILEQARHREVEHLVYASSSSVYGANKHMPFSVEDAVDHPVSIYAASKKANELMAHSYSHLFRVPTTGLRFFTVYGPWGRPDMALFIFTKAILEGKPLRLFNRGDMLRDWTYIDDIVDGVIKVLDHPAEPDPEWDAHAPLVSTSNAPYRVYNIGNGSPVGLRDALTLLEEALGATTEVQLEPMQPGDVKATHADVSRIRRDVGFDSATPLDTGIREFVSWYREYYGV